mmetsp:Transcript_129996/g.417313  ORF Transcript_129996/g.417313 Transcript_129996/m.417313 type:complete len:403 (-) Transcript_129996:32-1240(-)
MAQSELDKLAQQGDTTMQAVVFKSARSCEVVKTALPTPGQGQCLVRVAAAGLNPTDWKHVQQGMHYYSTTKASDAKPVCVGCEGSGVVERAEDGCEFKVGDQVWFLLDKMASPGNVGSLAEYACVHPKTMARVPAQMTMEQAASAPLALLTAYQALKGAGLSTEGCAKGKSILIHAGAGGVGHFAIQLARVYEFERIATTCSAENSDFVRSMGATEVLDYKTKDFVEAYSSVPFDVVLDAVGGEPTCCCCGGRNSLAGYLARSRQVTKRSGWTVGVLTGATLSGAPCGQLGAICCSCLPGLCWYKTSGACGCAPKYSGPFFLPSAGNMADSGRDLAILGGWVDRGLIKSHVSSTFSLDKVQEALTELEGRGHNPSASTSGPGSATTPARGKIVVTLPTKQGP